MNDEIFLKTPAVAQECNRSVNTVIKYAKEIGIYEHVLRTRRGDYLFSEEQVETIKKHSMKYQPKP